MFKVTTIVDKKDTALDRLSQGMKPYMDGIDYQVIDVHPKRPDHRQLERFEEHAKTSDVIDYMYFRTAEMLRNKYPWLKEIPSVLTHNNPYSITEGDWNDYNLNIGNNKSISDNLKTITKTDVVYIPLTVDPYRWKFNHNYQNEKSIIMVANRIEGKKGILPVAEACKKANIKMYLVGAISDANYFQQVISTGVVRFAQQISDEDLLALYHKAGLHVCNSVDNFESGTLPILESIFAGVPVFTRPVGHVPDLNQDNMFVSDHDPEDVDTIADKLIEVLSDKKKLETMRHDMWYSTKDRNNERRAVQYRRMWREVVGDPIVGVVYPVADKPEVTKETLPAIFNQDTNNLEIIVVDDGDQDQETLIKNLAKTTNKVIRYIRIDEEGYNLAKARNMAIVNSTSDILVFCDQRMKMDPDAINKLIGELKPKTWVYGSKGVKKEFVENFSAIYRDDLINIGMFNERIDKYGGMSQEVRARARKNGITTPYVGSAKATPVGKSSNKRRLKLDIMEMKNKCWRMHLE